MTAEHRQAEPEEEHGERAAARVAYELLHADETERQHHRRQAEREQQPDDVKRTEGVRDRAEDRGGGSDVPVAQQDEREERDEKKAQQGGARERFADRQEDAEERERVENRGLLVGEKRRAARGHPIPERSVTGAQHVASDARPRRDLREENAGVGLHRGAPGRVPRIRDEGEIARDVDARREERRRLIRGDEEPEHDPDAPWNGPKESVPRQNDRGAREDE